MLEAYQASENACVSAADVTSVSGRYEGLMTRPQFGKVALELRVDIDSVTPASLPMNRISGDLYQIFRLDVPGAEPSISKTYIESWIVDQPEITRSTDGIDIVGHVRFWTGSHAPTTVAVRISRDGPHQTPWASVTLSEAGGAQSSFTCQRVSNYFRELELEIDVCTSTNLEPLLPQYHTHWHNDRPSSLPSRVLTIEEAFRDIGVNVTISPSHTVIDDSAPEFESWTPAELHDAMATHFSQFRSVWPKWALWGLLASLFERPSVGGVMFDAASRFGGAGEGPERQGFAVFRNHGWFENLVPGTPRNQEEAWAIRHFLYTWVHEAGHAFNFLHSWDKGRPDSLSWMNYDWRYDQRNGSNSFWRAFGFCCDDDEIVHIRHGNRASVIMGGDPWSSGSHLEAPNLAMTQIEGDAPIEFLIRSKSYFEFMEPIIVELRLRNLMPAMPVVIDKRLLPEFGTVIAHIQKPDGRIVEYRPPICALGEPEPLSLAPAQEGNVGEDRFSREIFLSYGIGGFYFDQPGEYKIRAVYQGFGDILVPSNTHCVRVATPRTKEADRLAQDYFSDAAGLCLYLQGSRSPHLKKGIDVLQEVASQFEDPVSAANINIALANGVSRPFFRVADPETGKMKRSAVADPKEALRLTEPSLKALQTKRDKSLNLAYGRVVRRRAAYHQAVGTADLAEKELSKLRDDLAVRGAHKPTLDRYADMEESLSEGQKKTSRKRRGARRAPKKRSKSTQ